MALGSIATYKSLRGISGTAEDTRLTALLAQAEGIVRLIGDRDPTNGFESASRTEVVDGDGARSLMMREGPITAVASVTYLCPDGSTSVVPTTAYRFGRKIIWANAVGSGPFFPNGHLFTAGYGPLGNWAMGKANYSVVYTGGYATIPAGLAEAVYMVMDWMRADNGRGPYQSESIGGEYSYSRLAADPKGPYERVRTIVEGY
jgi:hypothetical protein